LQNAFKYRTCGRGSSIWGGGEVKDSTSFQRFLRFTGFMISVLLLSTSLFKNSFSFQRLQRFSGFFISVVF